jgi:hypothetical protein
LSGPGAVRSGAHTGSAHAEQKGLHVNRKRMLRVMRKWVAGALAASSGVSSEGMGQCGSVCSQSDLAIGQGEDLRKVNGGLGLSGERGRLLHAGDCALESLASSQG